MILRVLAPAKLNLFLHIIGRRADGYHLLQSVFTLLDFGDSLIIESRSDGVIVRTNELAGVPAETDLVVRAANLLQQHADGLSGCNTGREMGCNIHVEKRIPMGGGLGGGSSDAAAVLLGLNKLWGLSLAATELQQLGRRLGADVPFFVNGHSAFAEGTGEILTNIMLPEWWFIVLTPPEVVPTPLIFSAPELTRDTIPLKIADFSASGFANLINCRNDLQPVVLKAFPVVASYLSALQAVSTKAVFGARMTGSGACVFAAFEFERDAHDALNKLTPEYQGFVACGMNRHPSCSVADTAC